MGNPWTFIAGNRTTDAPHAAQVTLSNTSAQGNENLQIPLGRSVKVAGGRRKPLQDIGQIAEAVGLDVDDIALSFDPPLGDQGD